MDVDGFVVVNHPERAELLEKAHALLAPTEYVGDGSEYSKHLAAIAPETGEWLLRTDQFRAWQTSASNHILWIKGVPGSGKSILAASLVRHLAKDSVVGFAFIRCIVSTNNTFAFLVRDFIAQLVAQAPDADAVVKAFVEARHGDIEETSDAELWKLLISVTQHISPVKLVVDGLDEILPGQEEVLVKKMQELATSTDRSVKILITSRPLPHLEKLFYGTNIEPIRLAGSAVETDVGRYILHRLEAQNQRALSTDDYGLIQGALERSLFLQARLTLDEVLSSRSPVSKALRKIPDSLADLYQNLVAQYSSQVQQGAELQHLALMWTTNSYRPLRLIEVAQVAVSQGLSSNISDAKSRIRACCGPLIEIRKDETVHVCHHSFAEFWLSARDFTESDSHRRMAMTCLGYLLSGPLVNSDASKSPLLQYSSRFWQHHVSQVKGRDGGVFALLDSLLDGDSQQFAAWSRLSKLGQKMETAGMGRLHVAAYFGLSAYVEYLLDQGVDADHQSSLGRTALMLAVDGGHSHVVGLLISHGANLELLDTTGMTAVHIAVLGGHHQCLQELSVAGTNLLTIVTPGTRPEFAYSPHKMFGLSPEAYEGLKDDILQQFRIRGRHTSTAKSINIFAGCSPVQLACEIGSTAVLQTLIRFLDEATCASIPLHWAAAGGHVEILELLLQHTEIKSSINSRNHRGNTSLFVASQSGGLDAVKTLLGHRADAQSLSTDTATNEMPLAKKSKDESPGGFSALHSWAGMTALTAAWASICQKVTAPRIATTDDDFIAIGELLLGAGADVNAATPDTSRTALFAWMDNEGGGENNRQARLVALLLRYGADPRRIDSSGLTSLHLMKGSTAELPAVRLLVVAGADINWPHPTTGRTPTHALLPDFGCPQQKITAIHELALLGADFNRKDWEGDTPLHRAVIACCTDHQDEIVSALMADLVKVCDVNIPNEKGQTPLFKLRSNKFHRQFETISEALIGKGADIDWRDREGKTPLMEACRWRDHSVRGLVDLGADVQARDNSEKTCLHYLFGTTAPKSDFYAADSAGIKAMAQELVDSGASFHAVDDRGNTIFHTAVGAQQDNGSPFRDPLRDLEALKLCGVLPGLVDKVNVVGRSALHTAAAVVPKDPSPTEEREAARFDFLLGASVAFADISLPDVEGLTPLHLAAGVSEARVHKLLQAGADASRVSKDGRRPVDCAVAAGNANCVELLCEEDRWWDLYASTPYPDGNTLLHKAARSGSPDMVEYLLARGADSSARNDKGKTALAVALCMPPFKPDFPKVARVVAYVMKHAHDGPTSIWKTVPGEAFNKPPLDVFVEALDQPDHASIVRVLERAAEGASASQAQVAAHSTASTSLSVRSHQMDQSEASSDTANTAQQPSDQDALTAALLTAVLTRQHDLLARLLAHGALTTTTTPLFEAHESLTHALVRAGALAPLTTILPLLPPTTVFTPPLLHTALERRQPNLRLLPLLPADTPYNDARRARRVRLPVPRGEHTALQAAVLGGHAWHTRALGVLAGPLGREREEALRGVSFEGPVGVYAGRCRGWVEGALPAEEEEGETEAGELVRLIFEGDVEGVRALLEGGADPDAMCEHEGGVVLPLEACATAWDERFTNCEEGGEDIPAMMALLLEHGAGPFTAVAGSGLPVLHFVCSENGPVAPFLAAGVDLGIRDASGATPLICAAGWFGYVPQGGRPICALELIEAGGAELVNAVDSAGQTALHKAAMCESHLTNPEVMEALLRAGADTRVKDAEGHDAFYYFLRNGVGTDDLEHYKTDMLEDLWKAGADASDKDEEGETNLHVLANLIAEDTHSQYWRLQDDPALLRIYHAMVAAGADRNARTLKGETPVAHFVATTGHRAFGAGLEDGAWHRKFLLEHNMGTVNDNGDTLLHVLARQLIGYYGSGRHDENATLFRMLMELGVDPKQENDDGVSAVDFAAGRENSAVLDIFKESQG